MRVGLALCSIILMTAAGCGTASTDDASHGLPNAEIACDSTAVVGCSSGSGLTAFVGLTQDLQGSTCQDLLTSVNASTRAAAFDVSGVTTTSQSGTYTVGEVSSWINASHGSVTDVSSGTYSVCAFIDLNGNGSLDANEPVDIQSFRAEDSELRLETWSTAF